MNRSRLVRWCVLGFALHLGMAMGADGPPQGVPSGVDGQHSALHPAGVQAQSIFKLWQGTLWLCIAVFTLILCALLVGLARARRSSQSEKAEQATAAFRTKVDRDSDASRLWVTGATGISGALLVGLVAVDIWTDHALSRLGTHERGYLDHCRRFAFESARKIKEFETQPA